MQNSDLVAILALIIASGALALEVRRWIESGPRLTLSLMVNMLTVPNDDGEAKAALFVTNRGTVPTTLTNFTAHIFTSRWHVLWNKPLESMIVLTGNSQYGDQTLPYELQPNRRWLGIVKYDAKLLEARRKGQLYFGVTASHSDRTKRIFVKEPKAVPGNHSPP